MRAAYFEGTKEILPITRLEIDSSTYCDVSISQYWSSVYRNDCSCGVEKTRTWRRKMGWSKEYSFALEAELGFNLSIGLASLSPKITAKINKTINVSMEEEEQEVTKFTAPKCGKHEIDIYQLISEWRIKLFKNKKRRFRKPLLIEFNPSTYRIGESDWTESNNIYDPLPNCNCKDKVEYDGNVTLAINSGVINLPCQRLGDKIVIYGIKNRLVSQGEILKLQELPIEVSKHLHSSSEAKVLTFGEKMPILDIIELIDKFEELVLEAKEILLRYFDQDYRTVTSIFEIVVNTLLRNIFDPLQTLKNFLLDDEEKLRKMKLSLNKIRNGDLSEFSDQLNAFYGSYNEKTLETLLDPWIKEEHKDEVKAQLLNMFRELYDQVNKFYESCKELIIDFLTKSADLLFRLIDLNDIQEATLMAKEFVVSSEDQLHEFNNKARRLLNLLLDYSSSNEDALKFYEQLYALLIDTDKNFMEQVQIRNQLVDLLAKRLSVDETQPFDDLFEKYHPQMNQEELDLFDKIRQKTELMKSYNSRMFRLLAENASYLNDVVELQALKDHLEEWIGKYDRKFSDPNVAIIYVGEMEKKPLPTGIEKIIEKKISKLKLPQDQTT